MEKREDMTTNALIRIEELRKVEREKVITLKIENSPVAFADDVEKAITVRITATAG